MNITDNNPIKRAITLMGGPTYASYQLRVSVSTLGKWIRNGRIPRMELAEKVAAATDMPLHLLRPLEWQ